MNPKQNQPRTARERRWVLFDNGCIRGIQHSELVVVRSIPHRSVIRDSVAVFTVSRGFALIAGLVVVSALVLLLAGCSMLEVQKGGPASTTITRPAHTNAVTLSQSENPKEPSRQTVESEQTIEYVLPEGSTVSLGNQSSEIGVERSEPWHAQFRSPQAELGVGRCPTPISQLRASTPTAVLSQAMPVRSVTKDRSETSIGGAQKDAAREWAAKAANMQPVMWAGIAMMTLVAGALAYFGWWTKAALAVGVGLGMIVMAQTLPSHGTLILLSGLGVFALAALLVLYAYHKGQLDKNNNGIPDFLERIKDQGPWTKDQGPVAESLGRSLNRGLPLVK